MISGLLKGLWGYLAVAVVAVVGVLTFGLVKKREGRYEERVKQWEKANETHEKMDAVPDSSSDDTADSLHDEKF